MMSDGTWNAYARSPVAMASSASWSPKSLSCIVVRAHSTGALAEAVDVDHPEANALFVVQLIDGVLDLDALARRQHARVVGDVIRHAERRLGDGSRGDQ